MPATDSDLLAMQRALALARQNPAAPFGAVIYDHSTGAIVAEGLNHIADAPIWHGEIDAIAKAAATHPNWATLCLVTTAEPCPMCQSAILWAGIRRMVYGTSIRTLQSLGWHQIDILSDEVTRRTPFAGCEIIPGILEAECDTLFRSAR